VSMIGSTGGLENFIWGQVLPGFDLNAVIQALMASYEQPITDLQGEQAAFANQVSDWQQISSDVLALQSAAQALASPTAWGAMTASSSNTAVATATASSGAQQGSVSFAVDQLATANVLVSQGAVSSTSAVVTSSPDLLLSQASGLGFSALASSGLSLGSHSVQVLQASQAAAAVGTVDLRDTTVNLSGGATIQVTVNGTSYTLSIAPGSYTGSQLLAAIQSAIAAAGATGVLEAGYSASGQLVLATVDQGSSQSLQVTGGSNLSSLGLSVMASAALGADAIVDVDGTTTTLSTVAPGASYTLASGTGGSLVATVEGSSAQQYVNSSLISAGSTTAVDVSTGNQTLASVVQAINAAGVGFTASAIQTASGYQLELTASATGAASTITIAPTAFSSSPLGNLVTATPGQNAEVSLGGTGGPVISSPTNAFTGLLPGVTVNVLATSSSPVTVTVSPDTATMDQKVQSLINAANALLADIQKYAGYNPTTKTAGPLMGNPEIANLEQQVLAAVASTLGSSSLGGLAAVGITLTSSGTTTQLSFNEQTFNAAYAANPQAVAGLFNAGGTFAPSSSQYAGTVSLVYAGAETQPGPYSVTITQSASQATDLGATLTSGSVSAAETLTFTMGRQSVQYTTYAGESLATIASELNASFASAGLGLTASVVNGGTQLQVVSNAYGSAASFTVTSNNPVAGTTGLAGGGSATFTGTDVAGTINGVAASGQGQYLSAPASSPFAGLTLLVTASGITSSTNIGTFTYEPGLAQQYVTLADQAANPVTGWIGAQVAGLQQESQSLNPEIAFYQQLASNEQQMLEQEFTAMLTLVASLHGQGSFLSQFFGQTTSLGL
jgi:flagellar hook-associated protein 2